VLFAVRTVRSDLWGSRSRAATPAPAPAAKAAKPRSRTQARRLVVTEGALAGTTISLGDAPVTLGRADDSTLVLTDDYASSRHAPGEVAGPVAMAAIGPLEEDAPGADLLDALRQAATSANNHLRDMVDGDPALDGMGTTLTAVLSAGNRLGLLHIGDSRAYLL